jgi:hypothetical protein
MTKENTEIGVETSHSASLSHPVGKILASVYIFCSSSLLFYIHKYKYNAYHTQEIVS